VLRRVVVEAEARAPRPVAVRQRRAEPQRRDARQRFAGVEVLRAHHVAAPFEVERVRIGQRAKPSAPSSRRLPLASMPVKRARTPP
jgi:hypothetical protein